MTPNVKVVDMMLNASLPSGNVRPIRPGMVEIDRNTFTVPFPELIVVFMY
jgi:hypothetical protein